MFSKFKINHEAERRVNALIDLEEEFGEIYLISIIYKIHGVIFR